MAWPLVGRESEQERIRASLDDGSRRPLALVGAAGVGTSRLLECVIDHAARRGWSPHSVTASPALHSIPFGAVAPVRRETGLDRETFDRLAILAELEHEVLDRSGGLDPVMVVDEAQWLDDPSVALLERLRTHRGARIVLAIRDHPRTRPAPFSLATTDVDIIEVAPLAREAHDRLVAEACGGGVTRQTGHALWMRTGGRPRDLELLLDAVDRDSVDSDSSIWHWPPAPLDSPGLRAMVAEELAGLGDAARRAFELVVVGAPLPGFVADAVLDGRAREELERAELIELTVDDRGSPGLVPTRPLVGVGLEGRLGPTTRRRLLSTLAGPVPPSGADWALRHARWAAEAGITPAGDDRVGLARDALAESDIWLAEELVRAELAERGDSVAGCVVLAECLRRRRRPAEALDALDRAAALARTDDDRVDVAVLRAQVAALLNRAPDVALGVIDDALDTVASVEATRRLGRERSLAGAFVAALTTRPEVEGPTQDGEIGELLVTALLQCLHFELAGMDSLLARLRAAVAHADPTEPFVAARVAVCEHLAALGRGSVGPAHSAARAALDAASAAGEPLGLWALCVAFSGPLVGDLDGAAVAAFDADRSFRAVDPFGLRPFSAAVGATAALQAGRPDMAAALATIAAHGDGGADPRVAEIAAGRRDAWQAVIAGDTAGGALAAAAAGRLAMTAGHRLWGVIGLHEAVRLGAPELVIDDLRAASEEIDSPLVRAFAEHADALGAADAGRLDAVALDLAGRGASLLAAEAAAQGASCGRDPVRSARAAARAEIWWASCSGRVPPSLREAPRGLTDRQHEIARLAAIGLSSQEIAERFVVSRRTVDNHLRAVYRRLGLRGRDELAEAIGPALRLP